MDRTNCKEWDLNAEEDQTYRLTPEEFNRYQGLWYLTLNKAGKNGPMKLRPGYRAAVIMKKNRLRHESGEPTEEPIYPGHQRRTRRGQEISPKITCVALEVINIQDGNIGLQLQVLRGGTNPNGVGSEYTNVFVTVVFVYS